MVAANKTNANVCDVNLVGGNPCLDFANTVFWRGREDSEELLTTYADLVDWALRVRLVPPDCAIRLKRKAERHPEKAENIRRRATELRDLIYRIFSAHSDGLDADEDDLDRLSFEWTRRIVHYKLIQREDGFQWKIPRDEDSLDAMIVPILVSCIELLTSKEVRRVKKCSDQDCAWLFFDQSRNFSRRWCDMKDCGNRAKANRFRKRNSGAQFERSSFYR